MAKKLNFTISASDDASKVIGTITGDLDEMGDAGKGAGEKASRGFSGAAGALTGLNQGLELVKKGFSALQTTITAPLSIFSQLVQTSFDLVDAYDVHASALAQLEVSMRNTGAIATENVSDWDKWATAVQEATGVSRNSVLDLAAEAGAVVGFSDDTKRAVEIAIDAAAFGKRSIGESLGSLTRALATGSLEMARFGTQSLEAKSELGRFHEVLNIAEGRIKGFAAAAVNPIDQVRNDFRMLKEELGGIVINTPEFIGFFKVLRSTVKRFTDFVKNDSAGASNIFGLVFKASFDLAAISAQGLIVGVSKVGVAVFGLINALDKMKLIKIEDPVRDQLDAVQSKLDFVSQTLSQLAGDFETAGKVGAANFAREISEGTKGIDLTSPDMVASAQGLGAQLGHLLAGEFGKVLQESGDSQIQGLFENLSKLTIDLGPAAEELRELQKEFDFVGRAEQAMRDLKQATDNFSIGGFKKEMEDAIKAERELKTEAKKLKEETEDVGQEADRAAASLKKYADEARNAGSSSEEGAKGAKKLADEIEESFQFGGGRDRREEDPGLPPGATSSKDFLNKFDEFSRAGAAIQSSDIIPTQTKTDVFALERAITDLYQTISDTPEGQDLIAELQNQINNLLSPLGGTTPLINAMNDALNAMNDPAQQAIALVGALQGALAGMPEEVQTKIKVEVEAFSKEKEGEKGGGGGGGSGGGGGKSPLEAAGRELESAAGEIESSASDLSKASGELESSISSASEDVKGAADALIDAADGQSNAVAALEGATEQLASASQSVAESGGGLGQAADELGAAGSEITSALSTAASVLTGAGISLSGSAHALSLAAKDLGRNITINIAPHPNDEGSITTSGTALHLTHGPEAIIPLNHQGLTFVRNAFGSDLNSGGGGGRTVIIQSMIVSGVNDVDSLIDEIEGRLADRQTDRAGFG